MFHYAAAIVPIVIAATIMALARFAGRAARSSRPPSLSRRRVILAAYPPRTRARRLFVFPATYPAERRAAMRDALALVPIVGTGDGDESPGRAPLRAADHPALPRAARRRVGRHRHAQSMAARRRRGGDRPDRLRARRRAARPRSGPGSCASPARAFASTSACGSDVETGSSSSANGTIDTYRCRSTNAILRRWTSLPETGGGSAWAQRAFWNAWKRSSGVVALAVAC